MGLLSKLFGKSDEIKAQTQSQPPEKLYAEVELKSPYLLAFDLPAEGVKYKIPNFESGTYRIPMEAITTASDPDQSDVIDVDTGVIYFIDADYEENFRKFENKLFEETGDSYELIENPENYSEVVGIKFDCLIAPGIGSDYDFVGDGSYILDVSKIVKV